MRITDRAHVYAQQFELGGHVGAEERVGFFSAQLRCHATGHLIAGGNQTEHTAVPGRAFANCIDIGVAGAAVFVDGNTAARAEFQRALPGQRILRTNTGGKHDQIGFQKFVVGKIHPIAILLAVADRLRGAGQMHTDPQRFDARFQRGTAVLVQLHRHQARGKFDDMGFKAE
ncbi:hypothetical protein ALO94_200676 [Pseudomonas syringae pv. spinaceae]|uniref:ABC transporter permease n=1 Tax=Pseudomonas syringae pv. spinaceae TaxID=264459 RepID=A0A0Q0AJ73_PSESX|nr:hypothetical protein ALO94_200676 [Pseudomonas syringae pv. spinaceae]